MKILFVAAYVPNLIRVRPFNFIRSLTARGHQVTVATLWANAAERAGIEALQNECQTVEAWPMPAWHSLMNCLLALPTPTPLQAVYSWQPAFARRIAGLAKTGEFDVVHIEHLRAARYGIYLQQELKKSNLHIPVIWDSVDCISLLFRWAAKHSKNPLNRLITRFDGKRTAQYEGRLSSQFEQVLVTSPMDRQALLDLRRPGAAAPDITVLPNGVDLDYFTPASEDVRQPDTLVVSGKMSYHANVSMVLHLVEKIMPQVWAARPEVRLQIVGKAPVRRILALTENPNISVFSDVKDVPPYLQRATLALTPILYGVGIQNKVLEALACATPVVSTAQAVSALQVKDGQEVCVAQDPAQFAAAILRLLADPQERLRLGQAGRAYVEQHHNWQLVAGQLESIYQKLALRAGD